MQRRPIRGIMVATLIAALAAAGCETAGGSAGVGAAGGALAGAIIGNQSGHAAEGALIGAVVGGLAGYGIHKLRTRQTRTPEETASDYKYEPEQGFMLELRDGEVSPKTVKPGDTVTATVEYATLGTGAGVEVEESRTLRKGNEVLAELDRETVTRTDGTWQNALEFKVPKSAKAGEYTVTQRVKASGVTYQKDPSFRVDTQTASAPREEERVILSLVVAE